MTKSSDLAEKAMAEYRVAYEAANKRPPPMMRYERGWIEISTHPERMRFPVRMRRAELERLTKNLEWRAKNKPTYKF